MRDEHYLLDDMRTCDCCTNNRPDHRTRPVKRKPWWTPARVQKLKKILIWSYLVFLGCCYAVTIAFYVYYLAYHPTNYDTGGAQYLLYKNSRYAECTAQALTTTNCTLLDAWNERPDNVHYIDKLHYGSDYNTSWCEMVSCVKDYTVLPSTPRRSAITYTTISTLPGLLLSSLGAAWAFKEQTTKPHHDTQDCPKFGIITLMLMALDLGTTIFWWHSFIIILLHQRTPQVISLVAWITTWRHTYDGQTHPVSCWLDKHPGYRKPLTWGLAVATALQYVATCYLVYVVWPLLPEPADPHPVDRRYDCMNSQPIDYKSSCSYQEVCTKDVLLADPGAFTFNSLGGGGPRIAFLALCLITFMSLLGPVCYVVAFHRKSNWRDAWNGYDRFTRGPVGPVLCSSLLVISALYIFVWTFAKDLYKSNREATVAYHPACRVAHVALSPWKNYLDVGDDAKAFRIAKAWLNA
ncbi:hypothetical protein LTS10_001127 [Elasticomyces elasticus]|nr:hypothetical protein LTS10_001127 [Elasticomyces elasticus]